jgi:guanine nucleotide exchange protein RalF
LDLEKLTQLNEELQKPVKLSDTLMIQIQDCHPSSGTYKHALPKGYLSTIALVETAIKHARALQDAKNLAEALESRRIEIIEAFNFKPKQGIQKIKDLCKAHNITSVEEHIADFFQKQKPNLDLEAVGDYLSSPEAENRAVLKIFTNKLDFAGQIFSSGLRNFLKTFKLPGEAQKIDRLVESFSETFWQQNPEGYIADKDAGHLLAFQTIMLNSDLHNPSVAHKYKMDINGLKKNIRGCNSGVDFDERFLEELFKDIQAHPLELNFVKTEPGFVLASRALSRDPVFIKLDALLQSSQLKIQDFIPRVGGQIATTVDKPKPWLHLFVGYEGTLTLTDEKTQQKLVTIQIYNPSFLSKWIFGEQPKVIIQPVYQNGKAAREAIDLAAKIAASFKSPVSSIKATYDYLKSDLLNAYNNQPKACSEASNSHSWWAKEKREKLPEEVAKDDESLLPKNRT